MAVRGENSLFFATGIRNDGLRSGINEATGLIQGLAGTIGKINPFAILATGAVTAFATIASAAYNMMREFEQAMKEVQTISKAAQEDFKGISSAVFELSEISPDDPVKLAKAYYQIVSAGYDGAQGLKLLETAAKAATAGVTDTETAADGITTVLNAFKLEAEDASHVADILFQTVKLGKTNFEELSRNLAVVAPLAASSGFAFEEVAAAVASLTKQGTPTNVAMTQIRSGIERVSEVLGDGAAETMTLQNAFKALYQQAGGSQKELKELLGSVEAMQGVLGLAGKNAKGAAEDLESYADAAGAAEEANKRMLGSNVNEWQILRNRIKATTEELGNAVVQLSSSFAGFFNDLLEDSDSLKESFDQQRVELYKLKGALQEVNEGSDEYKSLRDQIISQYPQFLQGIDSEKASTQDLLDVLDRVNDAYLQRYKFAQRQEDLKNALQEQGSLEEDLSNAKIRFEDVLAQLQVIAEDNGVEIKVDYSQSDSEILASVKRQLDKVEGAFDERVGNDKFAPVIEGFANDYVSQLTQIVIRQNDVTQELEKQQQTVSDITERNKRLAKIDLETVSGRAEAIREINKATKESDFANFQDSGIKEIDQAIEARTKIIKQFNEINIADNLESLKPYLESENEEIKKLAEQRKRFLNSDFNGGASSKTSLEDYVNSLKARKEEYEKYQAVVNQIGEEAAKEQFKSLLKLGENYGEFLKGELDKTQNYLKQQAIAVEAEVSGIDLNRPKVESVDAGIERGKINFDFEIDQTSINAIERRITELNKKIRAALTDEDREALRERRAYWEERLKIAEGGSSEEEELFSDIYRTLNDLTYQGIRDYIKYWKDRLKEAEKGSKKEAEILGRIASAQTQLLDKVVGDATQQLEAVSGIFRAAGNEVAADLVDGLSSAANQLNNTFKAIKTEDPYSIVSSGIGAAIELTGMLVSASEQRKKASEDYYNSVIAQQKEYNRLLNEELRTQEGVNENVFTTDYENRIRRGIEAYDDAQAEYLNSLRELADGQVQAGTRNTASLSNILSGAGSGAAIGATIGSVIPGIGTLIGGAIGAVGGALAGLFGGREERPEYVNLLEEFPDLIQVAEDGTARLNEELAQSLLNQELLNEETRNLVENTLAWQEQMEAAKEQIRGVISDLAGGLGNNLRNALVDAFQAGESAALAMGDTVAQVIEDVVSQLIFDRIFSEQFKKLEEEMENSFSVGGDGTFQDDLIRFFNDAQGLTEDFNNALAQARDIASGAGLDVFESTFNNRTGMSGAISSITEDQAGILEGYMNAVRLDVRQSLVINQQSVVYLSEIAGNTRNLISIESTMRSMDGRFANIENQILEFQAQG